MVSEPPVMFTPETRFSHRWHVAARVPKRGVWVRRQWDRLEPGTGAERAGAGRGNGGLPLQRGGCGRQFDCRDTFFSLSAYYVHRTATAVAPHLRGAAQPGRAAWRRYPPRNPEVVATPLGAFSSRPASGIERHYRHHGDRIPHHPGQFAECRCLSGGTHRPRKRPPVAAARAGQPGVEPDGKS